MAEERESYIANLTRSTAPQPADEGYRSRLRVALDEDEEEKPTKALGFDPMKAARDKGLDKNQ